MPLMISLTKVEVIISKDVTQVRFSTKKHALRQILNSGRSIFLLVASLVLLLLFLENQLREFLKIYFYLPCSYQQFLSYNTIFKIVLGHPISG